MSSRQVPSVGKGKGQRLPSVGFDVFHPQRLEEGQGLGQGCVTVVVRDTGPYSGKGRTQSQRGRQVLPPYFILVLSVYEEGHTGEH